MASSRCSNCLLANDLANTAVDLSSRFRGVARSKRAKDHEHGDQDGDENHKLAQDWSGVAKFLPLHAALTEVLLQLLSSKLIVDQSSKSNAVAKCLEKRYGVLEQEHGCEDEEDILQHTGEGENERRGLSDLEDISRGRQKVGRDPYQEDNGNVEEESDAGIGEQCKKANAVNVDHGQSGELGNHENHAIDDGAGGSIVVERDEGVHLEIRTA